MFKKNGEKGYALVMTIVVMLFILILCNLMLVLASLFYNNGKFVAKSLDAKCEIMQITLDYKNLAEEDFVAVYEHLEWNKTIVEEENQIILTNANLERKIIIKDNGTNRVLQLYKTDKNAELVYIEKNNLEELVEYRGR